MAEDVRIPTEPLRNSDDPAWVTLRRILVERGVQPHLSSLAFSVAQGDDSEFAVVVTQAEDVLTVSWLPSTGEVLECTSIAERWRDSPYGEDVRQAIELRQ